VPSQAHPVVTEGLEKVAGVSTKLPSPLRSRGPRFSSPLVLHTPEPPPVGRSELACGREALNRSKRLDVAGAMAPSRTSGVEVVKRFFQQAGRLGHILEHVFDLDATYVRTAL
jgi:hypothetical protein